MENSTENTTAHTPSTTEVTHPSQRSSEKVIHPTESFKQEFESLKESSAGTATPFVTPASTVYPEATRTIEAPNLNASQQFAVTTTQMRIQEVSKPVSLRVKSLLIVAIVILLSGLFDLLREVNMPHQSTTVLVAMALNIIQLIGAGYLLLGKDHHTVGLILKFILIFQILTVFFSLANPTGLLINGAILVFLIYVYIRVTSLRYY